MLSLLFVHKGYGVFELLSKYQNRLTKLAPRSYRLLNRLKSGLQPNTPGIFCVASVLINTGNTLKIPKTHVEIWDKTWTNTSEDSEFV